MSTKEVEQVVWKMMQVKQLLETVEYEVYLLVKSELHRRAVEDAERKIKMRGGNADD